MTVEYADVAESRRLEPLLSVVQPHLGSSPQSILVACSIHGVAVLAAHPRGGRISGHAGSGSQSGCSGPCEASLLLQACSLAKSTAGLPQPFNLTCPQVAYGSLTYPHMLICPFAFASIGMASSAPKDPQISHFQSGAWVAKVRVPFWICPRNFIGTFDFDQGSARS